jgi:hypothetical protein
MIEHLFISSSYVLHFEWFKMLQERYLKVIIFEVQRKRSNEKITKKKIPNLKKCVFF